MTTWLADGDRLFIPNDWILSLRSRMTRGVWRWATKGMGWEMVIWLFYPNGLDPSRAFGMTRGCWLGACVYQVFVPQMCFRVHADYADYAD